MLEETWSTYKATGDTAARNVLIEHYLPLVRRVASHLAPLLSASVEMEDLVSFGTIGLIDAIGRYDPETSENFQGFAWKRVKGAIIDELRRSDTVPRSLRAMVSRLEQARQDLTTQHQRTPTHEEMATWLGVEPDEYRRMRALVRSTRKAFSVETLEEMLENEDEMPYGTGNAFLDEGDVAESYEIEELRQVVADAWNALPERERVVLHLRYVEGLTLTDIGQLLEVSPPRVSKVQSDAIRMLRAGISVL